MEINVVNEQIKLIGGLRLEFKLRNGSYHRVEFDYLPTNKDSFQNAQAKALCYLEAVKFMVERQHPFDHETFRQCGIAKDTIGKMGAR